MQVGSLNGIMPIHQKSYLSRQNSQNVTRNGNQTTSLRMVNDSYSFSSSPVLAAKASNIAFKGLASQSEIFCAAHHGNIEEMKRLVEKHPEDVNEMIEDYWDESDEWYYNHSAPAHPLLTEVGVRCPIEAFEVLLNSPKIDVNATGINCLKYSTLASLVSHALPKETEMLLNHPDIDANPISANAETPLLDIVKMNMDEKYYDDGTIIKDKREKNEAKRRKETLDVLLKSDKVDVNWRYDNWRPSALENACRYSNLYAVEKLLKHPKIILTERAIEFAKENEAHYLKEMNNKASEKLTYRYHIANTIVQKLQDYQAKEAEKKSMKKTVAKQVVNMATQAANMVTQTVNELPQASKMGKKVIK